MHKGKKILTAYNVYFQCQEVEMGWLHVKVLSGNLFTLPLNENTDKNENRLSKSTFRFKFENKSTNRWITLNLTVGQLKICNRSLRNMCSDGYFGFITHTWHRMSEFEILKCEVTLIRCSW